MLTKRRRARGIVHAELAGDLGRRAVIVDDILDTGATLISCCRMLARHGVREMAVVVTHGVLTGRDWLGLWPAGVRRLWLTNSIPARRARAAGAEVVTVAPLLAPLLRERRWMRHGHEG